MEIRPNFFRHLITILYQTEIRLSKKDIVGKKQKEEAKDTETVQQDDLEQRLMDTLSCVRGAGKVKVMIDDYTVPGTTRPWAGCPCHVLGV